MMNKDIDLLLKHNRTGVPVAVLSDGATTEQMLVSKLMDELSQFRSVFGSLYEAQNAKNKLADLMAEEIVLNSVTTLSTDDIITLKQDDLNNLDAFYKQHLIRSLAKEIQEHADSLITWRLNGPTAARMGYEYRATMIVKRPNPKYNVDTKTFLDSDMKIRGFKGRELK